MTHIPAMDSVCQLLVELQMAGHLDGVELPDWATGTSVEEVFNGVRYVKDAEWLDGVYEGYGPQESADRWLEEFLNGKDVPDIEDAARIVAESNGDDSDDEEADPKKLFAEYLDDIPKAAVARFNKRLEKENGFEASAIQNFQALGLAMAVSFMADDTEFKTAHAEFTFLNPESAGDPELAAMSKYYLIDNYERFLDGLDAVGIRRVTATKRIKVIGTKLNKAIKATAGAKT